MFFPGQAELGEARAKQIVRSAVGERFRKVAEQMSAQMPGTPMEKVAVMIPYFAAGDTIDVEMLKAECGSG